MKLLKETLTQAAIKMVLLDAIKKGHKSPVELADYMNTKNFKSQVVNYKKIISEKLSPANLISL